MLVINVSVPNLTVVCSGGSMGEGAMGRSPQHVYTLYTRLYRSRSVPICGLTNMEKNWQAGSLMH